MEWFITAADSLVLENEEFHELVAHPTVDVLTSTAFKKAVVILCSNAGYKSVDPALHASPA
jgi:hypothetical protein